MNSWQSSQRDARTNRTYTRKSYISMNEFNEVYSVESNSLRALFPPPKKKAAGEGNKYQTLGGHD